jgi:hypothetical protein
MSKATQLLEDLDYLEREGMTVEQLRSLHHWSGTQTEKRVSYATVRDYFGHERDMRENNTLFAERLHLVAEMHRRGIPTFVEAALRLHPSSQAHE